MKDTKDVTACVVDFGMFMPVAMKLSQHFKKVYYSTPTEKGFQEVGDFVFGEGFKEIERIDDYLSSPIFDEIDLFVFPYILYGGLQERLEKCGKAVWGARHADTLEMMKEKFYKSLAKVDLPVPDYTRVTGMKALRELLQDKEDVFIKMSRFRGTMDTWHHVTYEQSLSYLDCLTVKLGPFQNMIPFYIIEKIDTPIEGGIDTYCIDGQWPNQAVLGYERKNECYLATVKPMSDMPEELLIVNEHFGEVLAQYNYRQFFSTEVRVKNGKSYFIDPTCRTASPAGEEMLDLFGNIGDIIWRGAHGELVQPEITKSFAGEAYLHWTGEKQEWKNLKIPKELPAEVKLYGCADVDGRFWWPPDEEEVIGCIVAINDTAEGVIDAIRETTEALSDQSIKVDLPSFAELLKEIKEAESQGIEFSGQPIPEPSSVIEDA